MRKYDIGQKILWKTDDPDGILCLNAEVVEIKENHVIAETRQNQNPIYNGIILWIDDSTEENFY